MSKRAKQSFAFGADDGSITVINEDHIYTDDHPLVKAWPNMFRDVDEDAIKHPREDVPVVVEQATAAPGELRDVPVKRGPGRPRKDSYDQ